MPLNHVRPAFLVTNAASRSPEFESSISPSIPALPTLTLETNKLTPGATPTVAAAAAPFTAAFFLPPVEFHIRDCYIQLKYIKPRNGHDFVASGFREFIGDGIMEILGASRSRIVGVDATVFALEEANRL